MSHFDELKLIFNLDAQYCRNDQCNLQNLQYLYVPEMARFEIKGILGKGAFATVFSALDKVLKIQVAIKMVDKKLFKNKEQQDIVRQEAMMLKTLEHNNIVKILAFFETSLKFYIVMNQIDGVTLETHMSNVKSAEVVSITKQILEALSYLHQRNVVHRDIILLTLLLTFFFELPISNLKIF